MDEVADLPSAAVLASLGCGNHTALAELKPGDTVLDLGSRGGIEVLLSTRRVGPPGMSVALWCRTCTAASLALRPAWLHRPPPLAELRVFSRTPERPAQANSPCLQLHGECTSTTAVPTPSYTFASIYRPVGGPSSLSAKQALRTHALMQHARLAR